jgi:hypothetical protein
MNLSKHLTLFEMTRSETAKRKGVSNEPTPQHIENMKVLAEKIFEPIRRHFNSPIYISSGYRSAALNKKINGAKNSYHLYGMAMDLDQDGSKNGITNKEIFDFIKDNLLFTELIWEFGTNKNPDWVHVAYDSKKLNKEILIAKKTLIGTKYTKFTWY